MLVAFVLMTFFLSNVLNFYFILLQPRRRYPIEKAIATCGIGMNFLSCFAAVRAAIRIGRAQARQFYLADYEDLRQRIERAAMKISTIQDLRGTLASEEEETRQQEEVRRRELQGVEDWRCGVTGGNGTGGSSEGR